MKAKCNLPQRAWPRVCKAHFTEALTMMTLISNRKATKASHSEKEALIAQLLSGWEQRIFWVSEDPAGYSAIERLRGFGVKVTWGQTLEQAMIQLGLESFDLVVADEALFNDSSAFLLERFASQQPIAVITIDCSAERMARLALRGTWAVLDDRARKDDDLDLLVATMLFRRKKVDSPERQFGPVKACFDRHTITFEDEGGGRTLHLTSTEFRLLMLLLEGKGKVFQRSEILGHVWGGDLHVHARTVDRHIAALRQKLKGSPLAIESVHGLGYRSEVHSHY